ncbi:flagellar basal-body rod protein FlgG [bacterium]|nr:flagellar basal-body rod protein FlgG [bacterium]
MMRSLWTASTGMIGQQFNVDVISNNLANVNTTAFKKDRVDFEDLMYQRMLLAGTPTSGDAVIPTGIQVGLGTRVAATQKMFEQGSLKRTANPLDLAIEGEGFFRITLPDGTTAYTRDGSFKLDSTGRVVSSDGDPLADAITIPQDATAILVTTDGTISVQQPGAIAPAQIGALTISKFVNPAGLSAIGQNLYVETASSGAPIQAQPQTEALGAVRQGFLEMSNVQVVESMVDLITAQRAYEVNSRSIQTSDAMLQTAAGLKR